MRVPLLLMSFALLVAGIASAQVTSPVTFTMNSSFEVGNTTLPAGSYEIRPTDDQNVLEIQGQKGAPSVLFDVTELESLTPFKQTELVFNKYGSTLVLKSVKIEGETIGATTVTALLERHHVKAYGKASKVSHMAMKKKMS